MGEDISDHFWIEEAEDGGTKVVFDDELCEALGIEEGTSCDIRVVERNGKLEMEFIPDIDPLTHEQKEALEALASDSPGRQNTL